MIIDEAQECLPIIEMMKHFCEKRRDIPLIVSGSLVRIRINRFVHIKGGYANRSFLFPVRKINQLMIFPMTFDEFLINYKMKKYDFLESSFKKKQSINEVIHNELIEIFNDNFYVGGMPKVVNKAYLLKEKITFPLIESEYSLCRLYLSDMGLFTYQSGLNVKSFVFDKSNSLAGIYYENYLSIELVARGRSLFYWKDNPN